MRTAGRRCRLDALRATSWADRLAGAAPAVWRHPPHWSLRAAEVNPRRVRVLRPVAATPSRPGGHPCSGPSSRRWAAGSARWQSWPRRWTCSRPRSWLRPAGWSRWAGRSSTGEPSSAAPWRIGPKRRPASRACARSSSPPSTRSAPLEPGRELLLQGVAASGKTTSTSPPSRDPRSRTGRHRDGAGGEPRPADRPTGFRALIGDAARRPPLRALGGGAARRVVAHPARRGPGRDRHADGGIRAARHARAHHRRRGARRRLQVGPDAALRRALGGPPPRGAGAGAGVVLGSATPDLVTLARVRGGMRSERSSSSDAWAPPRHRGGGPSRRAGRGNRSIFSTALADALGALRRGSEQAVLLLNRRGAATFILCRDCGESLRCPDCELPFVFHLEGGRCAATTAAAPRFRPRSARRAGAPASATSAPAPSASRPSCGAIPRPAHRTPRLRRPGRSTGIRDDL